MHIRSKTFIAVALLLTAFLAGGCQPKTRQSNKEQANLRWNAARAGVMLTLAKDQYSTGNFEKCRKTLDDALKLDPQNPQLHLLSAKLSLEQGKLEAAERQLMLVRDKLPNDAESHYLSGVIYQRWQKIETAYDFYRIAGEKAPAELAYLMAEAEMLVALDRQSEALALLQAKIVYFENSPAIRDAVGQLLMHAKRYRDATDVLRQASLLAQDDLSVRERLALALYYDKQFDDALVELEKLTADEQYSERHDLLAALGECQLHTGRPRDARMTFQKAADLNPASAHSYLGLGRAALECGDLKRAEIALRKAQSLDTLAPEGHLIIGYLRLRQNRMKDALTAFQKAVSLDPKDTVALCMVGYVFEKSGRSDVALQYYGRALKLMPTDDLASRLMAGVNLND